MTSNGHKPNDLQMVSNSYQIIAYGSQLNVNDFEINLEESKI